MVLNLNVPLAWNKDWREGYRLEGGQKEVSVPSYSVRHGDEWALNGLYGGVGLTFLLMASLSTELQSKSFRQKNLKQINIWCHHSFFSASFQRSFCTQLDFVHIKLSISKNKYLILSLTLDLIQKKKSTHNQRKSVKKCSCRHAIPIGGSVSQTWNLRQPIRTNPCHSFSFDKDQTKCWNLLFGSIQKFSL